MQGGNPPKVAVECLNLAISRGEVFGLLGPNGAGKTSAINMLVGLLEPTAGAAYGQAALLLSDRPCSHLTAAVSPCIHVAAIAHPYAVLSGTAIVEGSDIREDMDSVYARMGVCPQHDKLWDVLTAREHLLFYGRLKNLEVRLFASF